MEAQLEAEKRRRAAMLLEEEKRRAEGEKLMEQRRQERQRRLEEERKREEEEDAINLERLKAQRKAELDVRGLSHSCIVPVSFANMLSVPCSLRGLCHSKLLLLFVSTACLLQNTLVC